MEVTAKNPRRKPRRSFPMTPLGLMLNTRRSQWLALSSLAPLLVWMCFEGWVPESWTNLTLGVAMALVPLGGWLTWTFPHHGYFLGRLHNLYRELP